MYGSRRRRLYKQRRLTRAPLLVKSPLPVLVSHVIPVESLYHTVFVDLKCDVTSTTQNESVHAIAVGDSKGEC